MDFNSLAGVVTAKIKDAENYYLQYIDPVVTEAYQIYEADPLYYRKLFPSLSTQIGDIQTADVMSKVEWILPSLLRIFFSSDDIVVIQGRTSDDDQNAKIMQDLINWQLTVRNQGFMEFYKWFKDALITGCGFVKCYWERVYGQKQVDEIINVGLEEYYRQNENIKRFRVVQEFPEQGLIRVRYELTYTQVNQPVIQYVPVWEVLYIPDGRTLAECSFVAHRKRVTADYLRRKEKEGIYRNVDQALTAGDARIGQASSYAEFQERPESYLWLTNTYGEADEGNRQVWLYECYTKLDVNNDGLLEDVIVTVCNNVILAIQDNLYKRPPIFMISPIPDLVRIAGRGLSQLIGQYQNIKTALLRQILLNLALTVNPKLAVDVSVVDIADLQNNTAYVRIKPTAQGAKNAIFPIIEPQSNPQALNFLELIETQLENESGVTRYTQGLDASSLNKTATGVNLIMNASNARVESIARIFAETGITELFRFLIYLNQTFIDEEVVVKLTNKTLKINPSDLRGDFDLIVNAGVGISSKQEMLQSLNQILNIQMQLIKSGADLVTPENIYHTLSKMLETLGFKNVDAFINQPSGGNNGGGRISQQAVAGSPQGEAGGGVLSGFLQRAMPNSQGEDLSGMAEGG